MPLSSKKIAALKPRKIRFTVSDGHGLTLRVLPSGLKSWYLRLSYEGRVSDLHLGHWPEMTLLQARQTARRKRKAIGLEPPRGYVFADAFKLWCNLKRGRIASFEDEKRRLMRYIISPLGRRQLDEITAPLVIATVRHIETEGHQATLKRVLMHVREIMDLAVCAGYIPHNPIERVSRIFAAPTIRPMPSIPWQQLPEICAVMSKAPTRIQVLFLFQLASMLRPGEVAKLQWSWIDNDAVTIPAEEMKKRRSHRVPLTPFMLKLLQIAQGTPRHPSGLFCFSGRIPGTHISTQTLAKYLHAEPELSGKLVAHGLRSIARCWMADSGIQFEVAEACLAHVAGSPVSRAYQRSDYFDARKSIMITWCAHIADCARCAGMLESFPDVYAERNAK